MNGSIQVLCCLPTAVWESLDVVIEREIRGLNVFYCESLFVNFCS